MTRAFEQEIIPMARSLGEEGVDVVTPAILMFTLIHLHTGLALAPWDVLGGGKLRSDSEEERRRETGENGRVILGQQWERTENEREMSHALEKVAKEVAGPGEPPSVQAGK